MAKLQFQTARRGMVRARIGLIGPAGAGKTFTALAIARGIVGPSGRIALIDSERGSATMYAGVHGDFGHLSLPDHHPQTYIEAIEAAVADRFDAVVIDSLSHAWAGRDGALELVDEAKRRDRAGNGFTAWRDVTPLHLKLVDSILSAGAHVIATMRSKTEWVMEKDEKTGKMAPRRVGLQPVQRDGMEYEFDFVADIDHDHNLVPSKTRFYGMEYRGRPVVDRSIERPGVDLGAAIGVWLNSGDAAAPEQNRSQEPAHPATTSEQRTPAHIQAEVVAVKVRAGVERMRQPDQVARYKGSPAEDLMVAALERAYRNPTQACLDDIGVVGRRVLNTGSDSDRWDALGSAEMMWMADDVDLGPGWMSTATTLLCRSMTVAQYAWIAGQPQHVRRQLVRVLVTLALGPDVLQAYKEAQAGEPVGPGRVVIEGLTKGAPSGAIVNMPSAMVTAQAPAQAPRAADAAPYPDDEIPFGVDDLVAPPADEPAEEVDPREALLERARVVSMKAGWVFPYLSIAIAAIREEGETEPLEFVEHALALLEREGGYAPNRVLNGREFDWCRKNLASFPAPTLRHVLEWSLMWAAGTIEERQMVAELLASIKDAATMKQLFHELYPNSSSREALWALVEKWYAAQCGVAYDPAGAA